MSLPQTLRCRACGWSWGPVGVRPWSPDPPQQVFLLCLDCRAPQSQLRMPGEPLRCGHCGSARVEPLRRCARCDAPDPAWGP